MTTQNEMNKNYFETLKTAKEIANETKSNGFVILKNSNEKIEKWEKLGYNVTYDYIIFSDFEQMKNFINGVVSFDYLDNTQKLHDEKIIYAFSKTNLIIL